MNSKKLILEVLCENSKVINLHKKFGFIVYGEFYRGEKKVLKIYLENKLNEQIIGQEDAIKKITESIMVAKTGLNDSDKPAHCPS